MPKYRKLYTKVVDSLDVNDMPDDFTRLFWVLLPLVLCREGRGLDNAAWLKSRLFPLREDVTQAQVYDAFTWCVNRGMIEPYAVNGRSYFQVPTFHLYQGTTIKEAESDFPPPPVQTYSSPTPELVQSPSGTDADSYADADADTTTDTTTDESGKPDSGNAVAAADDALIEYIAYLLSAFGMNEPDVVAGEAAVHAYDATEIRELIAHGEEHGLGPGWLRGELRAGRRAPPRHELPHENPRRYIEGQFADCIQH